MSVATASLHDPRVRLVREKYFSVRPKPLERWLWSKNVPASAERVFWLHWQEGQLRGDWCSEIPLRRVAHECDLDVSTVTRAYQCLVRLGCIRRTDPGRDPANPFQQATAVTEVRIPGELLQTLNRYPNRKHPTEPQQAAEPGRAHNQQRPVEHESETTTAVPATAEAAACTPKPASSLTALTGRDRAKALAEITALLSPTERDAYHAALRLHRPTMPFGSDTKVSAEKRAFLQETLATLAADAALTGVSRTPPANPSTHSAPRKLSLFHIARLKRDIQSATSTAAAPELLRQVVWSIEAGALRRFSPLHALHIALKKIREGSWTRPNRMPPNWARSLSTAALSAASAHEACSAA
jgi:hypothetical protein